jgi:hypothetical protein
MSIIHSNYIQVTTKCHLIEFVATWWSHIINKTSSVRLIFFPVILSVCSLLHEAMEIKWPHRTFVWDFDPSWPRESKRQWPSPKVTIYIIAPPSAPDPPIASPPRRSQCSWIRYHVDMSTFIFPLLLLPIDYHGVRPLADADRQDLQIRICCVVY